VLAKLYDDELRALGLQMSQLPILVAVAIFGEAGASMSALAEAIVMDRTTLTRNVRPLEKDGLLRIARSPVDARTRVVLLTRAGEHMLESVFPVWERVCKRVRSKVGAQALGDLFATLDEVIALAPSAAED
jgi:DNA-binding MarR family transcriptional regulator